MLEITMIMFIFYLFFQMLYIFYPLLTARNNLISNLEKEKGISILVPAFNEEKVIRQCLKGILHLNYTNFEAIFINDGSTDRTLEVLSQQLHLVPTSKKLPAVRISHQEINEVYQSKQFPNIYCIDKKNGGKADALNAGIEYSAKKIIITLDADSVLDTDSMQAINYAFEDDKVIAAGGMVQIGQGYKGIDTEPEPTFKQKGVIRFQILQYFTSFYLHKLTQARLKSIVVIAGAFGAFRRGALYDIGGFRQTVGEDMDITLRLHQLIKTNIEYVQHTLLFIPQAICYTECPETIKDLYNQRIRWQKAFVDCVFYFKKSFFRKLGIRLSIFFLIDSLLLGTLNSFALLLIPIMIFLNPDHYMVAVALFTITVMMSNYQNIATIIVSRRFGVKYSGMNYLRIFLFIPFEVLTYRMLSVVFVVAGTIFYFKNKEAWYVSKRIGSNVDFN
ncbi:glycosyltransferase family 2 protein [Pseudalkalibacillus sp. Hm43]|uniref:glycosyltransferase family 2 protein n=1 Tax=Pseudalkalibacillus sp. Hm43 TaxID=3450742 RepID=UPI003F42B90D